jgi:hypothetical protein
MLECWAREAAHTEYGMTAFIRGLVVVQLAVSLSANRAVQERAGCAGRVRARRGRDDDGEGKSEPQRPPSP